MEQKRGVKVPTLPLRNTGAMLAIGDTWLPTNTILGVYASVDYLRVTNTPSHDADMDAYLRLQARKVCARVCDGEIELPRPWAFKTFRGWKVGPVAWGRNPQGWWICDAKGLAAHYLATEGVSYANVPRMDLQVTVELASDMAPDIIRALAAEYRAARLDRRKPKYLLIEGEGDALTLAIGSRQSEYYFRIYDKSRQSSILDAYLLRFELEIHDRLDEYYALEEVGFSPMYIAGRVARQMDSYGLSPDLVNALYAADVAVPSVKQNHQLDAARWMQWMQSTVVPSMRRVVRDGILTRGFIVDWLTEQLEEREEEAE